MIFDAFLWLTQYGAFDRIDGGNVDNPSDEGKFALGRRKRFSGRRAGRESQVEREKQQSLRWRFVAYATGRGSAPPTQTRTVFGCRCRFRGCGCGCC